MELIHSFLDRTVDDPRISTTHISIYATLWKMWIDEGKGEPLKINRRELMSACKITGFTTYHKIIRQLHEYGYIGYDPSYNRNEGSRVYFTVEGIKNARQCNNIYSCSGK